MRKGEFSQYENNLAQLVTQQQVAASAAAAKAAQHQEELAQQQAKFQKATNDKFAVLGQQIEISAASSASSHGGAASSTAIDYTKLVACAVAAIKEAKESPKSSRDPHRSADEMRKFATRVHSVPAPRAETVKHVSFPSPSAI